MGGTSVLYISDIPLGFLSLGGTPSEQSLPELTWASLNKVPAVVVVMGSLMGGVHWVIRRRMQLAAAAADTQELEEKRGGEDD